ncbi:DUF58 domain-containing protein [Geotalea toluenoxydans]
MTLFLGFAAVNTGNNLLFLIVSAMLGFMAVSGVAGWANIRGLKLQLVLPEEIYAGAETLAVIKLTNTKRLMPSFLLQIMVCGKSMDFNYISSSSTETDSVVVKFTHRGLQPMGEALVFSPFPVNFFVRCNRLRLEDEFIVFPAPIHASFATAAEQGQPNTDPLPLSRGMEGEVNRIKDYAGGDPLKMIHWRLSAKHPLLKVKEMSAGGGEPVILDPRLLPGSTLEARLSSAVFLINRLIRDNRPVGLRISDRIIKPKASKSHRLRLLTELALYDQN